MAETAKIINPTKRVICPISMLPLLSNRARPKVGAFLKNADNYYVIAYINCSAESKPFLT
jgi:quinolinate synthase